MNKMRNLLIVILFFTQGVFASNGVISIESQHSVQATQSKLETILQQKGMTIFNQIDHAANANKVGHTLRSTRLVIFGNPKVGSPLMACQQSIALDLPQKALIWEDEKGKVWISYNDPSYLKERHKVEGCEAMLQKVTKALSGILSKAAN